MHTALIIAGFFLATFLGNFVVRGVLALAARRAQDHGAPAGDTVSGDPADAAPTLRGGLWIGMLERGIGYLFIIAGSPASIAIVIAIKGLARYPEFKDSSETAEKFIIGTLASLLWVLFIGVTVQWVTTTMW